MEKKSQTWLRRSLMGMLLLGLGGISLVHANPQTNDFRYPKVPDLEAMSNNPNGYPEVDPKVNNFYTNANNGTNAYAANPNMGNFYPNGNYGPNPYAGNFNGANYYANANYVPGQYQPGTQGSSMQMPSWEDVVRKGGDLFLKLLPFVPGVLAGVSNSSDLTPVKVFTNASRWLFPWKSTARGEFLQLFNLRDLSGEGKVMDILYKLGCVDERFPGMKAYSTGTLLSKEWIKFFLANPTKAAQYFAKQSNQDVCCVVVKSGWGGNFRNFFPRVCCVYYDPAKKDFLQQKTSNAWTFTDRPVLKSLARWEIVDKLLNEEILFLIADCDTKQVYIVLPH